MRRTEKKLRNCFLYTYLNLYDDDPFIFKVKKSTMASNLIGAYGMSATILQNMTLLCVVKTFVKPLTRIYCV